MTNPFEYDLAVSFLGQDEPLAQQIADLMQDRFSVFIYPKQQERLAGTDGEATLNQVFGAEARTVGVLYRVAWGTAFAGGWKDTTTLQNVYEAPDEEMLEAVVSGGRRIRRVIR